jgi:thiol-disulfide isomerase/thioredoxin
VSEANTAVIAASFRAAALAAAVAAASACGTGAPPVAAPAPPPPRSLQLNAPGAAVDVDAHLVPGHITVVDFWAEHCGACIVMAGMLAVQTADEPRILVRKVDVGDGFTPVAQAYKIGALPHFRLFDKHKRLRYILVGNDCLTAADLAKQLLAEP